MSRAVKDNIALLEYDKSVLTSVKQDDVMSRVLWRDNEHCEPDTGPRKAESLLRGNLLKTRDLPHVPNILY